MSFYRYISILPPSWGVTLLSIAAESIIATICCPWVSWVSITLPSTAVPTFVCKSLEAIDIDNAAISMITPPISLSMSKFINSPVVSHASVLTLLHSLYHKLTNSCFRTLHPASQDDSFANESRKPNVCFAAAWFSLRLIISHSYKKNCNLSYSPDALLGNLNLTFF